VKNITSHGLAYPTLTWGLPTLSLTTNSSWLLLGEVCHASSAFWCQYPNNKISSRSHIPKTGSAKKWCTTSRLTFAFAFAGLCSPPLSSITQAQTFSQASASVFHITPSLNVHVHYLHQGGYVFIEISLFDCLCGSRAWAALATSGSTRPRRMPTPYRYLCCDQRSPGVTERHTGPLGLRGDDDCTKTTQMISKIWWKGSTWVAEEIVRFWW